jgi:hypothetical protein
MILDAGLPPFTGFGIVPKAVRPPATGSSTCETLAGLFAGDVRDNLEKST